MNDHTNNHTNNDRINLDRMNHGFRLGLALSLLTAIACGGGGGGGGDDENAATVGGEVITTADGDTVSVEAHNNWTQGNELFARFEGSGWNEQACSNTIEKFEDAVEAQGNGEFAEALYMIGLTHSRCGNDSDARTFYTRALRANEQMCKARVAMGLLDLEGGNAGQARQAFERAVRDDPQCTSGYTNLAIMQREQGGEQEQEALRNLRRALAIESDYLPAFNQMALLYYQRGKRSGGAASLDLAEIVCRQAQLIEATYAPIYNTWGLVKIQKGDVIEALRFFEKAIELDASMFEAQMNFAQITISFRGYSDARSSFAKAVELRPNDYEAHLGLGAAHRGLEQFDQAKSEYERAIAIDANRPEAYFNLGILYHDYLSAQVEDPIPPLLRGKEYYEQFVQKARGNERYAEAVERTTHRCRDQEPGAQQNNRRRRARSQCRPGRIQLVDIVVHAMREAAEMQREVAAMEAEAARQQQQQQPAPTPPEGE